MTICLWIDKLHLQWIDHNNDNNNNNMLLHRARMSRATSQVLRTSLTCGVTSLASPRSALQRWLTLARSRASMPTPPTRRRCHRSPLPRFCPPRSCSAARASAWACSLGIRSRAARGAGEPRVVDRLSIARAYGPTASRPRARRARRDISIRSPERRCPLSDRLGPTSTIRSRSALSEANGDGGLPWVGWVLCDGTTTETHPLNS